MLKHLIFFFIAFNTIFPQEFEFVTEIGKFTGASSFSFVPTGVIYVADAMDNEIYKIDTDGNLLRYIGGFGWDASSFDDPADIFATALKVYVSDRNNHRIQIFDKDLNFLNEVKFRNDQGNNNAEDYRFGYPTSSGVSSMGDLFILDSENKRVLKFNITGEYALQFGNYQSGYYATNNPRKLAVTQDNRILVLDDSSIVVYDQFGAGLAKIRTNTDLVNINVTFDQLVLNSKDKIFATELLPGKETLLAEVKLSGYDFKSDISEAFIYRDNIYILTQKQIVIFKRKKG
ncbi:MAG: NHL repeat-containing protein [Ignavibacteriales bacterium]